MWIGRIVAALVSLFALPLAGAEGTTDGHNPFGVIAGVARRPDAVTRVIDLGAGWVRLNTDLADPTPDFAAFLEAGVNVVITVANRDPSNVVTTYGTPTQWIHAGFPFASKDRYEQDLRDVLAPVLPYLDRGRQVWVQAENEIGDASVNPRAVYWRGTLDQYLDQLAALHDAVKSLDPRLGVVLTSFASDSLDAAVDPIDPHHDYAVRKLERLLSEGAYDAADLHFYGCVEDIPAKIAWVEERLPQGRAWISTENGGPDSECPTTPGSWRDGLPAFEALQARQVPARLRACADGGGAVCLWFSLFDLRDEVDRFNHLGLLDSRVLPPREKPAYDAFRSFLRSYGVRSISVAASPWRVAAGETATVRGEIAGDAGCVAGQPVELRAGPLGGTLRRVRTGTTDADGLYRFAVSPHTSTRYRAVAPADGLCDLARSRTVVVRVS